MPKYVLDPSGKIIDKDISDGGESKLDASNVSQQILQNYDSFDNLRNKLYARPRLPTGAISLATGRDTSKSNVLGEEKANIKEGNLFPEKTNAEGQTNILVNPSFGHDPNKPIKYYGQYNSVFLENDNQKSIYAEELEMIAGVELNSLGIILSPKGVDLTNILFLFDYIVESIIYLGVYHILNKDFWFSKNIKPSLFKPIHYYFSKIINMNDNVLRENEFSRLVNYFIIGLDKFINTDPKFPSLTSSYEGNLSSFSGSIDVIYTYLKNSLLGFSKVGRNRVFLLIRKFQQESYWHSEILYNAKENESENFLDKFFIEFSQYYFKFIVERINIGYLIFNKDRMYNLSYKDQRSRMFNASRLGNINPERDKSDLEKRNSVNRGGLSNGPNDDHEYRWRENDVIKDTTFKTSIGSLPQLLKSDEYLKYRLSKSSIKQQKNFASDLHGKSSKRLPRDLVRKVEQYLGNEYMPFYFHDLRTNEIISMHAFLDSISDSFSPEYSSSSGYGRIDDVKHYIKTTRNINLTFSLVSMEKSDHDLMWYQINKIVSMVYPQWSQGIPSNNKKFDKDFRFPFTQMPTSSPLIRLRVGDVFKTNYSFNNLKRLHGNKKYKKSTLDSIKEIENTVTLNDKILSYKVSSLDEYYVLSEDSVRDLTYINDSIDLITSNNFEEDPEDVERLKFLMDFKVEKNGVKSSNGVRIYKNKSLEGKEINLEEGNLIFTNLEKNINNFDPTIETIFIKKILISQVVSGKVDPGGFVKDNDKKFVLTGEFTREPSFSQDLRLFELDKNFIFLLIKTSLSIDQDERSEIIAIPKKAVEISDKIERMRNKESLLKKEFYDSIDDSVVLSTVIGDDSSINNPYSASFSSSYGQGLAGFITNLNVEFQDSTWETNNSTEGDNRGSLAPHSVKITLGFSPIHDIAPGLDHEGIMRAPIYDVGSINNTLSYGRDGLTGNK